MTVSHCRAQHTGQLGDDTAPAAPAVGTLLMLLLCAPPVGAGTGTDVVADAGTADRVDLGDCVPAVVGRLARPRLGTAAAAAQIPQN